MAGGDVHELLEQLAVAGRAPRGDAPPGDALFRIGDDQIFVDGDDVTEAVADGAGAGGVVEGEEPGLRFGKDNAAARAFIAFREGLRGALREMEVEVAFAHLESEVGRIGDAVARLRRCDQPVDDDVDLLSFRGGVVERNGLSLLEIAMVAFEAQGFETGGIRGMGESDDTAGARRQPPHMLHDIADLFPPHGFTAGGAEGVADAGIEQPQIVMDFGGSADGGAGALAGVFLLDGDSGRDAVDLVDVRAVHPLQKLAGIGGKRLDIPALSFGVEGIEGQARFTRTRNSGDHHQLVAGDGHGNIFQIMGARPDNLDGVGHGLLEPRARPKE